jgi:hypothetical protein
MFLITPTMLGSLMAGVAMWLMFWYGVNHVDSIPYLNKYLTRKMILDWIKKNPQTAILLTEGLNLLLHGIGSASAVFFNLGGTLVNIAAVFGFAPAQSSEHSSRSHRTSGHTRATDRTTHPCDKLMHLFVPFDAQRASFRLCC